MDPPAANSRETHESKPCCMIDDHRRRRTSGLVAMPPYVVLMSPMVPKTIVYFLFSFIYFTIIFINNILISFHCIIIFSRGFWTHQIRDPLPRIFSVYSSDIQSGKRRSNPLSILQLIPDRPQFYELHNQRKRILRKCHRFHGQYYATVFVDRQSPLFNARRRQRWSVL